MKKCFYEVVDKRTGVKEIYSEFMFYNFFRASKKLKWEDNKAETKTHTITFKNLDD